MYVCRSFYEVGGREEPVIQPSQRDTCLAGRGAAIWGALRALR